jgi:hydroxymethylpyrimidine pyrophosphatase-like HAD family hydrolase
VAETLPRLVATDLDGTLLRSDGTVSAYTRDVLLRVEQAGIQVLAVTARPPLWLDELAGQLGSHGLVVCANGAFVYDLADRRVLVEHPIPAAAALEVAADLRRELPGIAFAVEHRDGSGCEDGFYARHPMPDDAIVGPLEELLAPAPGKLLARHARLDPHEFVDEVARVAGSRLLVAYSGAVGLAEMTAPGVTKAAGLQDWCSRHGIPAADVWAFGDMPNDLPMLTWAGRSFAVEAAHPDVAAAATDRCGDNDDDGVARRLAAALDAAGAA